MTAVAATLARSLGGEKDPGQAGPAGGQRLTEVLRRLGEPLGQLLRARARSTR